MAEIQCDLEDGACGCLLSDVLDLLGRKYAMEVVCVVAAHERARFGDVEAHLPAASTSTLSDRLDELEAAGLLAREQYDEIPPRVEYELTAEGRELGERLEPLLEWAADYEAPG
jgi:DNA-binding HxlR family transcriptional regulator